MKFIKTYKIFESASMWNEFIQKVNNGIIPKDEPDYNVIDKLSNLIPKNSKVLDISIGDGVNTEYFIKKNFDVYGTDISDLAIETMKEKYPNNTWIVHDTLEKFPFSDNFFNLIFARLSLHYFNKEQIKNVLLDIHRMLKNDSVLYIMVKSSNTGNVNTGKVSYTIEEWIEMTSELFEIIEHKEAKKKAYSFESSESNLLEIIAKK